MRRRAVTLAGALGLAAGAPAAAHADSAAILGSINAQRASAGISPISTRSDWDQACGAHDAYMVGNRTLTHVEDPSNSLFTSGGSWAAEHSILARDSTGFVDGGNPWASSPFHEFQALHPWLRTTGVDISGAYACMITLAGRDGGYVDSPRLITYPGVGQIEPASEVASESPFVPGEDVGLPAGTVTGPHLYVYAVGPLRYPSVEVRSASLTAGDGSDVAVRWVDHTSAQSGPYLDGGAIVIPVRPLDIGQTYTLRVEVAATAADGTVTVMSRTAGFAAGAPNAAPTSSSPSTAQAASGPQVAPTAHHEDPIATLGNGGGTLSVALAWSGRGLRARIHCASPTESCEGPLRILVNRRGHEVQKLRFVARGGPLKVDLAPGRSIVRRLKLTRRQRHSGAKRGFSIRWGGPTPVLAKALDYS